VILAACIIPAGVTRADEPALDGTVESFVTAALERNPALAATRYSAEAAREAVGTHGALPDPVLGFGYFVETPETRVGPQESAWMLSQRFPFFGKLSKDRAVARKTAGIAAMGVARDVNNLRYDVKRAFFEYYAAVNILDVLQEEHDVLERMEEIAQVRYGNGLVSQQDALKAQLALSRVHDEIQVATRRRVDAATRLNQLLDRRPDAELPRPVFEDTAAALPTTEEIVDEALRRRPELLAATMSVERAADARSLAGRQYYPDLTLGAQYIQVGERDGIDIEDNGKDIFQVNASINLPLWFGQRSARVQEAEADQARVRNERASWETRVRTEVANGRERARIAADRVVLYRDVIIPQAQQAFEASESDYQTGKTDFINYLDSERMLLSVRRQYFDVLAGYGSELARLERAAGGPTQ
jgi:outer membrane protein TolC